MRMREQPHIEDEKIVACLRGQYDLRIVSVTFLPIGYDPNARVYQAHAEDGTSYFLKLRLGALNQTSLLVPRALIDHGITQVVAPLRTVSGALWCALESYAIVLYPFVSGENAMVAGMSDAQWREFGATLKAIHTSGLAEQFRELVPTETFALPSGALVQQLQTLVRDNHFESPAAQRFAAFWNNNAQRITGIVARAEGLGRMLQTKTFEYVLCHADVHAANILLGDDGALYIVDWDAPLIAPRERDLLFVVGSIIARRVEPREEALFFQGYGAVNVDPVALAYYRYERAIEDIGEGGRAVFLNTTLSEESRDAEASFTIGLFEPGDIVASALDADSALSSS